MRILKMAQGSPEWLDARLALVTASELDNLISPTWKIKTGEGPKTYLMRKIAEAWLCQPVQMFSTFASEQGQLLEPEAKAWFEITHDCTVETAGFIVGDDNRCGCSPDGIIAGKKEGVEIKCCQPTNAVRYAIDGILPPDYELQVHGSLYVTGFDRWHFISYSRQLPKFECVQERQQDRCDIIAEALAGFYARFDAEWEKLNSRTDEPRKNPFAKKL